MKSLLVVILVLALALSWLGFWTVLSSPPRVAAPGAESAGTARRPAHGDTVTVWVNELIGSPDEAFYYELADLWNATHERVAVKMAVMSHAGYLSKLRVAIASGQPPDVCLAGLETLESLKYTGKASDLAVTISEEYFPDERLGRMGPVVKRTIVRDGRPTVFPMYRYCYGGVILANRAMLAEAGYDDARIREEGWTFEQFRDACRRMTRDLDGDGAPDTWGFGAALVHLRHLFLNEFGPGVWGREVSRHMFLYQDTETGRWGLHPDLTEEQVFRVFLLFDQLLNQDKTWSSAFLSMNWNEINDELIVRRRLGMTFGETPWAAKLRGDIWDFEAARGLHNDVPPPDLTVIWMPTEKPGRRPLPRAGVVGFSVLKQTPYKGDQHTENALRVALYLTHPVHLARSQVRRFRHLPPEPARFAEIFPELLDTEDPLDSVLQHDHGFGYPLGPGAICHGRSFHSRLHGLAHRGRALA